MTYQAWAASTQLQARSWSPSAVKALEFSSVSGEVIIIATVSAHLVRFSAAMGACGATTGKFGVRGVTAGSAAGIGG